MQCQFQLFEVTAVMIYYRDTNCPFNPFSPRKIEKHDLWDSKISQTLNAIAKSINLHIIRKLIKYSLKKDFLKAMFTLSDFEILLFEARSIPWPAQLVTGSRRVKISVKNQRNVRLLLELLEKSLPYRLRRFWMVFIFLIYFNPFSPRKIEKHNFWDSSNSTNFKHQ